MAADKNTVDVSLEELLEAGAHFGHQARRWNPKMESFLYDVKEGVHIFDLVKTRQYLLEALDILSDYAQKGKVILFVGTKKQASDKLKEVATKAGQPYVSGRWLGGTLTNFDQILRSIRTLGEMKEKMEKGEYAHLTKRERLEKTREIAKLEEKFGGISSLKSTPDLLVIIDSHKEKGAVSEANALNIPTIAVIDSNSDPTLVTYPIPMNDDASSSIEFILDLFGKALAMPAKKAPAKKKAKANKSTKTKKEEVKKDKK